MTDIVEQFDNLIGHIAGINDERDVVPLLLELKELWPQMRNAMRLNIPVDPSLVATPTVTTRGRPQVRAMDDLIKRLEKATGPDREVDWSIHETINGEGLYGPQYTASLDDAVRLVPKNHKWSIESAEPGIADNMIRPCASCEPYEGEREVIHFGASPAIALCIAALMARNAREKEQA